MAQANVMVDKHGTILQVGDRVVVLAYVATRNPGMEHIIPVKLDSELEVYHVPCQYVERDPTLRERLNEIRLNMNEDDAKELIYLL